ncbi:MAG: hypothetical protein IJA47_03840 [Oscillospiraceae bacterium]|nr:hypothetical protein [Oscillospiraceae bacterium]
MKHKSIKLLLWAIFILLLALYLPNFGIAFLDILSVILMVTAVVFAVGSWITEYISEDKEK